MILTFTEYLAPVTFKSGKTGPARWKAGGTDYLLTKGITVEVGQSYDCIVDTTHSPDGKFTNHTIKSATPVSATAPESAPIQTSTPTFREAVATPAASPSSWRPRDPTESLHIVRQTAIKASADLVAADRIPLEDLLPFAQRLVNWVYETDPQKISASRTTAQSHLEDIREKSVAIRADYADSDHVCGNPDCGRKEFLVPTKSGGFFCDKKRGGCGYPPFETRDDHPWTYGEWQQRTPPPVFHGSR
jgi:hypothetical protein